MEQTVVKSILVTIAGLAVVTCARPSIQPVSRAPLADRATAESLALATVARVSLSIDVVKRGDMPRDLSAPGWLDLEPSAKAMIRIPESWNWEIVPGLPVTIHLPDHTGVNGRVSRSDPQLVSGTHPSSIAGTHLIEVRISDSLPPDMYTGAPVDGTFHLTALRNVLFVTRTSSFGAPGTTMRLFRLVPNSDLAEQTPVQLGRSSDTMIEIEDGARLGDSLIVSDMVRLEAVNRVRIK
jgi:hypothetical protein